MKANAFAAIALLAASVTPALAGDLYVLGSLGRSTIDQSKGDIDSAITSAGAVGLSSSMDNHDTGYKLQLGYQYNPNLAVEAGYVDLGKLTYSATYTGGAATASGKASGFNVAVLGIAPISEAVSVFGKLGTIDGKVSLSANATGPGGAASGSASATKWKGNYGLCLTYHVNKALGIRFEFEQFNKLGDKNKTGESNVNLLSVGVAFKF